MKILLTNDDGYLSRGLLALESKLSSSGHEVYVCAPETQRSANSHGISFYYGVQMKKISNRLYVCSGTPADCVLFFIGAVFSKSLDLVISGINIGYNLGSDIIYSGTVAAAREAALRGVPSMAVSLEDATYTGKNLDFGPAAGFIAEHLNELYPFCTSDCFLNINIPKVFKKGFQVGKVGTQAFLEKFIKAPEKDGSTRIKLIKRDVPECEKGDIFSDFETVKSAHVSVTPLKVFPCVDESKAKGLEVLGKSLA